MENPIITGLALGTLLFLVLGGRQFFLGRRLGAALRSSGQISSAAWKGWAESSGYSYTGSDDHPKVAGDCNGVPFRLACEIRVYRSRNKFGSNEWRVAETTLHASMRTSLPGDLFIYPMPTTGRWIQALTGGGGVAMFPALDKTHVSETANPEGARRVLAHPDVMPHLGRLLVAVPQAKIDCRSVQASFSGMPTLAMELDRIVESLTAFIGAVQQVAPGESLLPVESDLGPLPPAASSAQQATPTPILSSAQLPKRRPTLAQTLLKVSRSPSDASMLTLHPLEYTIEFHLHKAGIDHKDRATGGRMVCGDVARSVWRVELLFDPEDTEAVEALEFGAVIEGVLEVLETDTRRKRVLAKSLTHPLVRS